MPDFRGCQEISACGLVDRSCHACSFFWEKKIFSLELSCYVSVSTLLIIQLSCLFCLYCPFHPPALEANTFKASLHEQFYQV